MIILSIDPSYESGGLGYAVMELTDGEEDILLHTIGTIETGLSTKASFESKVVVAINKLDILWSDLKARYENVDEVVLEMAEWWGSYKSMMSAKKGIIHKLFFFTGALYHWAFTHDKAAHLITVSKWKGQVPKEVTKRRVERTFGRKMPTTHESDAVGLGLYYLENEKSERQLRKSKALQAENNASNRDS